MNNKRKYRNIILLAIFASLLITACGPDLMQSDAATAVADYYQFERGWGALYVSVPGRERCKELSAEAEANNITAAFIIEYSVEGKDPDGEFAEESGTFVIIGTSESSLWMVDDSLTGCP